MIVKYFATIRTYTGESERRVDDTPPTLGPLLETLAYLLAAVALAMGSTARLDRIVRSLPSAR